VPTGMKAGVRISPRCIAIAPARAAPSVADMVKAKRVTGGPMAMATAQVEGRVPPHCNDV
jgi:hypothetical protein